MAALGLFSRSALASAQHYKKTDPNFYFWTRINLENVSEVSMVVLSEL